MKKLLLTISLVSLMMTAILSGCAGSGSGSEGTTAATDKTAASDVSIDQLISANDPFRAKSASRECQPGSPSSETQTEAAQARA